MTGFGCAKLQAIFRASHAHWVPQVSSQSQNTLSPRNIVRWADELTPYILTRHALIATALLRPSTAATTKDVWWRRVIIGQQPDLLGLTTGLSVAFSQEANKNPNFCAPNLSYTPCMAGQRSNSIRHSTRDGQSSMRICFRSLHRLLGKFCPRNPPRFSHLSHSIATTITIIVPTMSIRASFRPILRASAASIRAAAPAPRAMAIRPAANFARTFASTSRRMGSGESESAGERIRARTDSRRRSRLASPRCGD